MKLSYKTGLLWVLGTTVISGISVYINKFGVAQFNDPFVYTTLKNSLVAIGLFAAVGLLLGSRHELQRFTSRQWLGWLGLGLIGGGVPFLMFFWGLAHASAPSAALIHKTLFLWVAILAVPLLGERLGGWQLAGLGVLAVGQFLLRPPSAWGWGTGEIMILLATLLWAAETILAKKVLPGMTARTAALGRMGVGAGVMWLFLAFTGRATTALSLAGGQWFWVVVTSIFLMGYVWTWYSALKVAPAVLVTSVLTLSALITILLDTLVEGQIPAGPQLIAILLLAIGGAAFLVRPSPQVSPSAVTG